MRPFSKESWRGISKLQAKPFAFVKVSFPPSTELTKYSCPTLLPLEIICPLCHRIPQSRTKLFPVLSLIIPRSDFWWRLSQSPPALSPYDPFVSSLLVVILLTHGLYLLQMPRACFDSSTARKFSRISCRVHLEAHLLLFFL